MPVIVDKQSAKELEKALSGLVSEKNMGRLFKEIGETIKEAAIQKAKSYGGRYFMIKRQADAIHYKANGTQVEIGSSDWTANQVQFGGPISAPGKGQGSTFAKALTIPISPKAYGKRVRDFNSDNIFFMHGIVWLKAGKLKGRGKGKHMEIEPLFVLVKKTKPQRARPFLPWGEDEIKPFIDKAIDNWMRAI